MENKLIKLKKENRSLKETCDILTDSKVMNDIKISLEQIKNGKGLDISQL